MGEGHMAFHKGGVIKVVWERCEKEFTLECSLHDMEARRVLRLPVDTAQIARLFIDGREIEDFAGCSGGISFKGNITVKAVLKQIDEYNP